MKHCVWVATRDPGAVDQNDQGMPGLDMEIRLIGGDVGEVHLNGANLSLLILDAESLEPDKVRDLRQLCRTRRVPTLFLCSEKLRHSIWGGHGLYLIKPMKRRDLIPYLGRQGPAGRDDADSGSPESADSRLRYDVLMAGPLVLYPHAYRLFIEGVEVELPLKEFQLLVYLMRHPHQVLTREQLYGAIGPRHGFYDPAIVTVYVKNIRQKLGAFKTCIRTVWGTGYCFVPVGG